MDTVLAILAPTLTRLDWRSAVDIGIVALVLYWLLSLISGTSAAALVRGILVLLLVGFALSNLLNLTLLGWLLRNSIPAMFVAVPILFAAEIRRALEQLGRAGSLIPRSPAITSSARTADTLASAARQLADRRWGALMVLERGTALGEYATAGVPIDGVLSVDLLLNIFYPNSPLHDGAVIIRGDRVVAAQIVLPLTQSATIEHMGTRHRAAVGITERTKANDNDETKKTGRISIANAGRMVRNLSQSHLRKVLAILDKPPGPIHLPWRPAGPPQDEGGLAPV